VKPLELHTSLRFGHPELPTDQLILGDNLSVLSAQADESLDLIYVDPPFATGTTRRSQAGHRYDDKTPLEPYLLWLRPRLAEMRRTLSRHGSLFVHLDYRAVHYVKIELDRLFGASRLVNELVWCYSVGGKSKRTFGRKHDTILWYAKSAHYAFFPDAVRIPRKPGSHMRVEHDDQGRPVQVKRDKKSGRTYRYPVHAGKIPEDYWTDIETLNRGDGERTGWPTQKPEALLERIVRAASTPGARVADLFCGSGTTAVVAQRQGRSFLAVDASREAVSITRARLHASGTHLTKQGQAVPDVRVEALTT
jgi:DNA modification methylase